MDAMSLIHSILLLCLTNLVFVSNTRLSNLLGSYKIDKKSISVSGFSAGGFMAMQLHVAYSDLFIGAGIISGGPYYCAEGSLEKATNICRLSPHLIDVNKLIGKTKHYEQSEVIARLSNLENSPVYVFGGTMDTTVYPDSPKKAEQFYMHFNADVLHEYDVEAGHGFPTLNKGAKCPETDAATAYINNCNYDAAFVMLQHIYKGKLKKPVETPDPSEYGDLLTFDQTEFAGNDYSGLLDEGYIFVPNQCKDGYTICRLHVSLHGCTQSKERVHDVYVKNTGYLETAIVNDMIILSPQAKTNTSSNPHCCFDWWGYTDQKYATRDGVQMTGIFNMVQRILGNPASSLKSSVRHTCL